MEQINDISRQKELKEIARNRYYCIARDEKEIFYDNALMLYHTTSDGLNFHIIEIHKDDIDSDDILGILEETLHDIADRTASKHLDNVLFSIMGAVKREELDDSYDCIELDLGYVIPGLLDSVQCFSVEDEEQLYEYTSATNGDYGPSNPWDAPGMSISDFI